jgi:glc operon protein GlcG
MSSIITRHELDAAGAEAVLTAAVARAEESGARVVVTVVDRFGHVLGLRRTPGAQRASDAVSMAKARTAAIFVRPSREIEEQVSSGRLGALALHGAAALTGGIPLRVGDEVVGAVGTSGETPDEDEAVSRAGAAASFSTAEVPALSAFGARKVAAVVGSAATFRGVSPVVAVVDAGGELLHLWRPDAAQVASVGVATDKARTAALYRRPSKDFEEQAAGSRPSALHLAGAVPLQGGVPLEVDGQVVGAVGVSGASSADEDSALATIGASALAEDEPVVHVAAADVFEPGGILVRTPGYAVDGGRRSGPGEVEVHPATVDVMHVVEGGATVVTGERDKHQIGPGDVLVVPAGVPHRFAEVGDGFRYLVTKVEG